MTLPTIRDVINANIADGKLNTRSAVAALVDRENEMADMLRLAGAQFGLHAEIVAEVLAEIGIGTPLSERERSMIRQNFIELMNRLREQGPGNSGV